MRALKTSPEDVSGAFRMPHQAHQPPLPQASRQGWPIRSGGSALLWFSMAATSSA